MRNLALAVCVALTGCDACLDLDKGRAFPCDPEARRDRQRAGEADPQCAAGWFCTNTGLCVDPSKPPEKVPCEPHVAPVDDCLSGLTCASDGLCRDPSVGVALPCDGGVASLQCLGGWRCGIEGVCRDPSAPGPWLCDGDALCSPGWKCALTGHCVDPGEETRLPAGVITGAGVLESPLLPELREDGGLRVSTAPPSGGGQAVLFFEPDAGQALGVGVVRGYDFSRWAEVQGVAQRPFTLPPGLLDAIVRPPRIGQPVPEVVLVAPSSVIVEDVATAARQTLALSGYRAGRVLTGGGVVLLAGTGGTFWIGNLTLAGGQPLPVAEPLADVVSPGSLECLLAPLLVSTTSSLTVVQRTLFGLGGVNDVEPLGQLCALPPPQVGSPRVRFLRTRDSTLGAAIDIVDNRNNLVMTNVAWGRLPACGASDAGLPPGALGLSMTACEPGFELIDLQLVDGPFVPDGGTRMLAEVRCRSAGVERSYRLRPSGERELLTALTAVTRGPVAQGDQSAWLTGESNLLTGSSIAQATAALLETNGRALVRSLVDGGLALYDDEGVVYVPAPGVGIGWVEKRLSRSDVPLATVSGREDWVLLRNGGVVELPRQADAGTRLVATFDRPVNAQEAVRLVAVPGGPTPLLVATRGDALYAAYTSDVPIQLFVRAQPARSLAFSSMDVARVDGGVVDGWGIAGGKLFRLSGRTEVDWQATQLQLPGGADYVAAWMQGEKGRVLLSDGRAVALPSGVPIGAALASPPVAFAPVCGVGHALTSDGVFALETADGGAAWRSLALPPFVAARGRTALLDGRLLVSGGDLWLTTATGAVVRFPGAGPCR